MKKKLILTFFFIILLFIVTILTYLNIDPYYFRKKTILEKTHLSCLKGISIVDSTKIQKFGIINIFLGWKDKLPQNMTNTIKSNNSILMITWEPYLKENKNISILQDIINGTYDDLIKKFANELKEYAHPVLLRWGHEMNGDWYSWSGKNNNMNTQKYIEAYKHIYEIFSQINSKNVKFIFSINNEDVPKNEWNKFENYYPGNEYVDFIGIDVYNWGDTKKWTNNKKSKWHSLKNLLIKLYERIINNYPEKPIILTEIATTSSGGDKVKWVESFLHLTFNRFPAIKGFVWFDINKETDWAITQNEEIMILLKNNSSYFTNNTEAFVKWIYLEVP